MNASQLKFKMKYVFNYRSSCVSRQSFSFEICEFKTILARKHKNMIVMFQEVKCTFAKKLVILLLFVFVFLSFILWNIKTKETMEKLVEIYLTSMKGNLSKTTNHEYICPEKFHRPIIFKSRLHINILLAILQAEFSPTLYLFHNSLIILAKTIFYQ